jgi:hypothetical protein
VHHNIIYSTCPPTVHTQPLNLFHVRQESRYENFKCDSLFVACGFALRVMISADVYFGCKGSLHFVDEKLKGGSYIFG